MNNNFPILVIAHSTILPLPDSPNAILPNIKRPSYLPSAPSNLYLSTPGNTAYLDSILGVKVAGCAGCEGDDAVGVFGDCDGGFGAGVDIVGRECDVCSGRLVRFVNLEAGKGEREVDLLSSFSVSSLTPASARILPG